MKVFAWALMASMGLAVAKNSGSIGAYTLNANPATLDSLIDNYQTTSVDLGFLLIKNGQSCQYANLSDGSMVHPINGHLTEYKRYLAKGGDLGIVLSGASSSTTYDPLEACTAQELFNIVDSTVQKLGSRLVRVSYDIEDAHFQQGVHDSAYYNKLLRTASLVKAKYPWITFKSIVPQWSGYWAAGYNTALRNFLNEFDSYGQFEILTSANRSQLVDWVNYTLWSIPSKYSSSKSTLTTIQFTDGNKTSAEFDSSVVQQLVPGFAGYSALLSDGDYLSTPNAKLNQSLNRTILNKGIIHSAIDQKCLGLIGGQLGFVASCDSAVYTVMSNDGLWLVNDQCITVNAIASGVVPYIKACDLRDPNIRWNYSSRQKIGNNANIFAKIAAPSSKTSPGTTVILYGDWGDYVDQKWTFEDRSSQVSSSSSSQSSSSVSSSSSQSSQGACVGVVAWDANESWTNYHVGDYRTHNGHKWVVTSPGYAFYEPGTAFGVYGWADKGSCNP